MMTDPINQKISQYLDGDLERGEALELFKHMQNDVQLQNKLQRYLVAQQALRSIPVLMAESDFLSKVKHELEHEPVYLMPRPQPVKPLRKASMLALVASLGALAVIVPVWKKATAINPSGQMLLTRQQTTADIETPERVRTYPVNQRFESYLQAHNGSLYTNGTARIQTQARLASYGQE